MRAGAGAERLVDYFLEVVAEPRAGDRQEHGLEDSDAFIRRVARRIPSANHADFPLPDGIPFFCIPDSDVLEDPSAYDRRPSFFSFLLTCGDGTRAYGYALHCFEEYAGQDSCWRPRVFCLISRHPFFSLFKEITSWVYRQLSGQSEEPAVEAHSRIAQACDHCNWFISPRHGVSTFQSQAQQPQQFFGGEEGNNVRASAHCFTETDNLGDSTDGDADRQRVYDQLTYLIDQVVRPPSGCVLHLHFDDRDADNNADRQLQHPHALSYHVQRGKALHLDDQCFQLLFQCLSLDNVVHIINCMLLEQRILIHSNHLGLLTPVCEALCALMYPFTWEHVYIPFLPVKLVDYLQAPVPYMIGLHTSSLATRVGSQTFASCVVVHLDKNKVVSPIFSRVDGSPMDFTIAHLPSVEVNNLMRSLAKVVPRPIGTGKRHKLVRLQADDSSPLSPTSWSSPSSDRPVSREVELAFGEGPLGITFESTHLRLLAVNNFESGAQLSGSAVVKALPRLQNGLPGPAERSGSIAPGSFLVAINGVSTLDLTFEGTIDRLRREQRPVRLRFLNSPQPYENARQFAQRLQALSQLSPLQVDRENRFLPWVDTVRGAFAILFTTLFRQYRDYIHVERSSSLSSDSGVSSPASPTSPTRLERPLPTPDMYGRQSRRRSSILAFSVKFDSRAFCSAAPPHAQSFLAEFTQTQSFADFINDGVLGRAFQQRSAHSMGQRSNWSTLELFRQCVHLAHEASDPNEGISLLFQREATPVEHSDVHLRPSAGRKEGDNRDAGDVVEESIPSKSVTATGEIDRAVDEGGGDGYAQSGPETE